MSSNVNTISYEELVIETPQGMSSAAPASQNSSAQGSDVGMNFPGFIGYFQTHGNPMYDPNNNIEVKSPPPAGLNMNPADCFGVSSNPSEAEEQLLQLMEWTTQSGFDKRNCALIWVCAMVGFNMRLNEWNDPSSTYYGDPSVLTIKDTLNNLTNAQDINGLSLSDAVVQNITAMALYAAYDKNGGNLTEANQTLKNTASFINGKCEEVDPDNISNPMLMSFYQSGKALSDPTNFKAWEGQYIDTTGALKNTGINPDTGAKWTFSDQCIWLSGYGDNSMAYWCANPSAKAGNNLHAIENQSRSEWGGNMYAAGYSFIYVIILLLQSIIDTSYIDLGSLAAEQQLNSAVSESYSKMRIDATNPDLTQEEYDQMMQNAGTVDLYCQIDPRLSGSAAGTTSAEILKFYDPTQSDGGYSAWKGNYYTPTTPDQYQGNGQGWTYDPTNPTDPKNQNAFDWAQQENNQKALNVQQLNNNLTTGSQSLTSWSQTLGTQEQTEAQFAQQAATAMENVVTKNSDENAYIANNSKT